VQVFATRLLSSRVKPRRYARIRVASFLPAVNFEETQPGQTCGQPAELLEGKLRKTASEPPSRADLANVVSIEKTLSLQDPARRLQPNTLPPVLIRIS
jgi:hypothetical protein